jgi:hypothetical protein
MPFPRQYLKSGQLQISSAFVVGLPLEGKTLVEALGNVNVCESPSVTEMVPDKYAEVCRSCDEALLRLVNEGVLVA